ncbi:AlwI family type II restriction endonuclease [Treponema sp.]|uniref:AlwI family type II restriction endonuclease n=1 Tax=Treponema sp. TaxID=166 RepID=UPI00298D75EA|nr:AlwI family type II restriction endonuclease [Treponema sp.]
MASWGWRTKPRSAIRTVQWYKEFGSLEGRNWDEENIEKESSYNANKIHPIRRIYNYNAHSDENEQIGLLSLEEYLSGQFDQNEVEGDARNDKTTYEFFGFGFVDEEGIIRNTQVGKLIIKNKFDNEEFLKQLLKINLPNKTYKPSEIGKWNVFPMEIVLKVFAELDSLNKYEIVFLFGCIDRKQITKTVETIKKFKFEYEKLANKVREVENLCIKMYEKSFGKMDNKLASYLDYADALFRSLIYTGLFYSHGRGNFSKLRICEHSKLKVKLLTEEYIFLEKKFATVSEYMAWFGDPDSILLPWNNVEKRKLLVKEKTDLLRQIKNGNGRYIQKTPKIEKKIEQNLKIIDKILNSKTSDTDIKVLEKDIITFITNLNEENFKEELAYTEKARAEILERFECILKDDDMSALWLEVNTWKSLISIKGEKEVKRNFNIEEDLTPKSFAPGIGNTPDMELYTDDYIILPEVSLMTGVRQWEHEGSSVIDHVYKFIKDNDEKKVFGLFISSSINVRTKWQFFILNRESWIGKPVPVIPMTIEMYNDILKFIYEHEIEICEFINLIIEIHKLSLSSKDFDCWYDNSKDAIKIWKTKNIA